MHAGHDTPPGSSTNPVPKVVSPEIDRLPNVPQGNRLEPAPLRCLVPLAQGRYALLGEGVKNLPEFVGKPQVEGSVGMAEDDPVVVAP